ncbi:hypothetical protein ACET3Z_023777 [Daucus carota]
MDRFRSYRYHNPEPYTRRQQRFDATAAANHRRDSNPVVISYRILCHDTQAGCVIGQAGSIIKSIRQTTGAWINVHDLMIGDEERVIEIYDARRREMEGGSSFSPAQEALFMIHDRLLKSDLEGPSGCNLGFGGEEWGIGVRGGGMRVVTRLVVEKTHIGSLLGKGGGIIEQMKAETRTQIKILPMDRSTPKCVSMSEEIVQIVGNTMAVKHAVTIISSRLRESQLPSPESRLSANLLGARENSYPSLQSAETLESSAVPMIGNTQTFSGKNLVFGILCPVDKINRVVGERDGILNLLQTEVGVAIKVIDPVVGADEQIIIISSEEGPDDELFPAQEALLHIQTRIVDLFPDMENIVTTRLLIPSGKIIYLEGRNGLLSKIKKSTGINVQILPNEQLPVCASGNDVLLQGAYAGNNPANALSQSVQNAATIKHRKDSVESAVLENFPSSLKRSCGPLVTTSTLEVVIPQHAVAKLVTKSKDMVSQISELSGATVKLIENGSEATVNVIRISGTPEQAERAQTLLQGFILSTQEDGP